MSKDHANFVVQPVPGGGWVFVSGPTSPLPSGIFSDLRSVRLHLRNVYGRGREPGLTIEAA